MVTAEGEKIVINDDEQKIIDQIEYYFSDINLRNDRFMKYQLRENSGWFPLDKLMTFNKLKSLSTDKQEIIDALKKSTNNLIELSECQTKLRRIKPMPEFTQEYNKQLNLRTIHLKGFPKSLTFDELKNFLKNFGEIDSIEMRKQRDGTFKGCCMVIFKTKDLADSILSNENLKYNDIELMKENKERYFERKKLFYESLRNKKKNKNKLINDNNNNNENKNDQNDEEKIIKTKGAIMKIFEIKNKLKYIDVKNELTKHSKVAFVTAIDETNKYCMVRFQESNGAKKALKALYQLSNKNGDDEKMKNKDEDKSDDKKEEKLDDKMEDETKEEDKKDKEKGEKLNDDDKKEESDDKKDETKEEDKKDEEKNESKDEKQNTNDDDDDDDADYLTKEFSIELCGQMVKVLFIQGDEEKNYWKEFNQTVQQCMMERSSSSSKKNKWQRGKKRHFGKNQNNQNNDQEPKQKKAKISKE